MRAIFGLVGMLMVVAIIIFWLQGPTGLSQTEQTIKAGQRAQAEVAQIGGRDIESHLPAANSARIEPQQFGGRLDSLLVTKVVQNGAYEKFFGLKADDVIVAIEAQANEMRVRDIGDAELALAQVTEAYSKKGHLVVMRDGVELRLPKAQQAAQPTGGKSGSDDPIQKQLDVIQAIPGAR
jgi:hypothetical protein